MSKGLIISIGLVAVIIGGIVAAFVVISDDDGPADLPLGEEQQEEQEEGTEEESGMLGERVPVDGGDSGTTTEQGDIEQEETTEEPAGEETMKDEDPAPPPEEDDPPPEEDEPAPPPEEGLPEGVFITVNADDAGYTSDIPLEASAGDNVEITFNVSEENVYYGGLEFRSSEFQDTGTVEPGGSTTVVFVAPENNFIFNAWWPQDNVKKWDATFTIN